MRIFPTSKAVTDIPDLAVSCQTGKTYYVACYKNKINSARKKMQEVVFPLSSFLSFILLQ